MKSYRRTNKSLKIRKSKKSRKTRKTKKSIKSKRGGGSCTGYTFDLNVPIARDMAKVVAYAPNCQAGGKRKRRSRSKRQYRSRK